VNPEQLRALANQADADQRSAALRQQVIELLNVSLPALPVLISAIGKGRAETPDEQKAVWIGANLAMLVMGLSVNMSAENAVDAMRQYVADQVDRAREG
jgi:hypothetical protein